jgi:hypothetical protein
MKTIRQEIKSFAIKLRREILKREKFANERSEDWQESLTGQRYDGTTGVLDELWEKLSQSLDELLIDIPNLK